MLAHCRRPIRALAVAALALGSVLAASGPAAASQDATVAPPSLTNLGYPELRITVTATGVEAPDEIEAGRYLVTVEAAGRGSVDVHLVQLPEGVTEAQAETALLSETEADVPSIVHEWDFAGGLFVPVGETDHLVLDLTPGDWFIVGADTGGETDEAATPVAIDPLRPLTVTPGDAAPAEEPPVTATVELREFAFSGLPDGSAAGRQIWEVTNVGEQVHHIILAYYPGEITVEQVQTLVALGDEGTPSPDFGVDPALIEFEVGQVHVLSPGRTIWVELNLEQPGSYLALCFMPDAESGMDHASLGMVDVFTLR